jgi:hypothetical protein
MEEKKRKEKAPEQMNLTEGEEEFEANKKDGGQCVTKKVHKASNGVNKQDIKTERVNLSADCVFTDAHVPTQYCPLFRNVSVSCLLAILIDFITFYDGVWHWLFPKRRVYTPKNTGRWKKSNNPAILRPFLIFTF